MTRILALILFMTGLTACVDPSANHRAGSLLPDNRGNGGNNERSSLQVPVERDGSPTLGPNEELTPVGNTNGSDTPVSAVGGTGSYVSPTAEPGDVIDGAGNTLGGDDPEPVHTAPADEPEPDAIEPDDDDPEEQVAGFGRDQG